MNPSPHRAETIAILLAWIMGVALFAWSWSVSGSFLAAVIVTLVGGFFAVMLVGPFIAVLALALDALLSLAGWLWARHA